MWPPSSGSSGTKLNRPTNRLMPPTARQPEEPVADRDRVLRGHLAGDPAGADDAHRAVGRAILQAHGRLGDTDQAWPAAGRAPSRSARCSRPWWSRRRPVPGARGPARARRRGSRPSTMRSGWSADSGRAETVVLVRVLTRSPSRWTTIVAAPSSLDRISVLNCSHEVTCVPLNDTTCPRPADRPPSPGRPGPRACRCAAPCCPSRRSPRSRSGTSSTVVVVT